jgi:hypothetical protein
MVSVLVVFRFLSRSVWVFEWAVSASACCAFHHYNLASLSGRVIAETLPDRVTV